MFLRSNHKYGAKKVTFNGITFDSKLEYQRYLFLKDAERNGIISNLELQKKFVLIPAQYEKVERFGKKGQMLKPKMVCVEKECAYYADFVYTITNGVADSFIDVVEDTKSKATRTEVYRLKRKLMLDKHGIRIREVAKANDPVIINQ